MATGPRSRFDPVYPGRPRTGLLQAAGARVVELPERFANGIEAQVLGCRLGQADDPCDVATLGTITHGDLRGADAFLVRVPYTCSPTGQTEEEFNANARAMMTGNESRIIAAEFESGAAVGTNSPFLRDSSAETLATGVAALEALERLEGKLADCSPNGDGLIHAPREVVTRWDSLGLVHREAGQIVTANGTPIAADVGYTGLPPDGDATVDTVRWAYVTGPVTVWLSPIEVVGSFASMDRTVNTVVATAIRDALVWWDGCCHAAVGITGFPDLTP